MTIRSICYTGSVFLSLSAASLALFFSVLFYGILSLPYFFLVFLLTYAVYAMDRLVGIDADRESQSERTAFLERHKGPFTASAALAFAGALLLAAVSSWQVLALTLLAPLVVALYSGNLTRRALGTRHPALKQYFIIKDGVIAAGWAFLLPLTALYTGLPMSPGHWLFLIPLLIKLFVMAAAYDFKDIRADRRTCVRTLPIVVGEPVTKMVLHFLNIAATVFILLLVHLGYVPLLGTVFLPAFIYQAAMIQLVRDGAPEWVYFVVCDLEQVVWLLFLILGGWCRGHF